MSGPISENWTVEERDGIVYFIPPWLRPVTLGSLNQRLLRVERLLASMPDYPGDDEE